MLILASKSDTRKTLLDNAGLRFSVRAASIDERAVEAELLTATHHARAKMLAEAKALAVSADEPEAYVIGADQTLDFDGEALHKPRDRAEAAQRLLAMAGKSHHLHSGAALAHQGAIVWSTSQSATLTMKSFTQAALDHVLDLEGDAILSSVGGYRLEGPSVRLFETIKGDYFTILGLPLLALLDALERHAPHLLRAR